MIRQFRPFSSFSVDFSFHARGLESRKSVEPVSTVKNLWSFLCSPAQPSLVQRANSQPKLPNRNKAVGVNAETNQPGNEADGSYMRYQSLLCETGHGGDRIGYRSLMD